VTTPITPGLYQLMRNTAFDLYYDRGHIMLVVDASVPSASYQCWQVWLLDENGKFFMSAYHPRPFFKDFKRL
jgi:hypothetical protein